MNTRLTSVGPQSVEFWAHCRQTGSARWAARCSGGLKSLWRSDEGRHIQEAGFAASLAGESGRYGDV